MRVKASFVPNVETEFLKNGMVDEIVADIRCSRPVRCRIFVNVFILRSFRRGAYGAIDYSFEPEALQGTSAFVSSPAIARRALYIYIYITCLLLRHETWIRNIHNIACRCERTQFGLSRVETAYGKSPNSSVKLSRNSKKW